MKLKFCLIPPDDLIWLLLHIVDSGNFELPENSKALEKFPKCSGV